MMTWDRLTDRDRDRLIEQAVAAMRTVADTEGIDPDRRDAECERLRDALRPSSDDALRAAVDYAKARRDIALDRGPMTPENTDTEGR